MRNSVPVVYTESEPNTMKNDSWGRYWVCSKLKSLAGSLPPNARMQLA